MEITLQTQETFYVYMHTFKSTGKSYIGYTGSSISARLERHYKNAFVYNIKTHFYNALRKYGIANIVTKCLAKTHSKLEAHRLEKQYIRDYDTINNGYNIAEGGNGGCTIIKGTEQYEQWFAKKLKKVQGSNNPRYSGYTDEDLVATAANIFINNGCFNTSIWKKYAAKNSLPQSFSKMRFNGGGWRQFIILIKENLLKRSITFCSDDFKYNKSNEHKTKIGIKSKTMKWYNNGSKNTRTTPERAATLNLQPGKIKND